MGPTRAVFGLADPLVPVVVNSLLGKIGKFIEIYRIFIHPLVHVGKKRCAWKPIWL